MHSRIFQVDTERINPEDRITSDNIPEWFVQQIADYTNDDTNRDEDIRWFNDHMGPLISRVGDEIEFVCEPSDYFREKFKRFKEYLEKLSKATLEEFSRPRFGSPFDMDLYILNSAYNDKYGFYIYEDDELYTIDQWMRTIKKGDVYYIGSTIDYHC